MLFSVTIPFEVRAFNLNTLKNETIENLNKTVSYLATNSENIFSFLRKHKTAVGRTIVGAALVWKVRQIKLNYNLYKIYAEEQANFNMSDEEFIQMIENMSEEEFIQFYGEIFCDGKFQNNTNEILEKWKIQLKKKCAC